MTPEKAPEAQARRASPEPTPEQREVFLVHLRTYLSAMYPSAGDKTRRQLLRRARTRLHFGRLGEVAGILVSNHVRHEHTQYEQLMRINAAGEGLTRPQARKAVALEVEDIAASWRRGSAEDDEGYIELRKQLSLRRRKKGKRKNNPGIIANENEAVAAYLKTWLEQRNKDNAL